MDLSVSKSSSPFRDFAPAYSISVLKVMYIGIGYIMTWVAIFYLRRENAKKLSGQRDEIIRGINDKGVPQDGSVKIYESLEEVKKDRGDLWSGYIYTL